MFHVKMTFIPIFLLTLLGTAAGLEKKIVICEGVVGTIKCDMEAEFVIVEANFGRTATDVCPSEDSLENDNTECSASEEGTIDALNDECDAEEDGLLTQCTLTPSTAIFGGDPCPDIKKYLEVTIDCQFTVESVSCNGDGTETVVVSKAQDKWIRISECDETHHVGSNEEDFTITFECGVGINDQRRITVSDHEDGGDENAIAVAFTCGSTAGGGPVTGVFVLDSVAVERTTKAFLTGRFEPNLVVGIVDAQGNPVTEADIGDEVIFFAMLDNVDSFTDVFSIHINLVSVTALGKTVILTGGEDDDAGCKESELWGVVEKVSSHYLVVNFAAFDLFPDAAIAVSHTFTAIVSVCENPYFDEEHCGLTGCVPREMSVSNRRKKRAVTGANVDQYQSSTQLIIRPQSAGNDNTDNPSTGSQLGNNDSQTDEDQICMKSSVLYGLIGFFIPALILAFAASICMYLRSKRDRRKEETTIVREKGPYPGPFDRKSTLSSFRI